MARSRRRTEQPGTVSRPRPRAGKRRRMIKLVKGITGGSLAAVFAVSLAHYNSAPPAAQQLSMPPAHTITLPEKEDFFCYTYKTWTAGELPETVMMVGLDHVRQSGYVVYMKYAGSDVNGALPLAFNVKLENTTSTGVNGTMLKDTEAALDAPQMELKPGTVFGWIIEDPKSTGYWHVNRGGMSTDGKPMVCKPQSDFVGKK